jgi:hypothetical protein
MLSSQFCVLYTLNTWVEQSLSGSHIVSFMSGMRTFNQDRQFAIFPYERHIVPNKLVILISGDSLGNSDWSLFLPFFLLLYIRRRRSDISRSFDSLIQGSFGMSSGVYREHDTVAS